ncbi:ABC transporter substrate-binding protein [Veronia pacifica]|uniref:Autoinducer 2-binding periplasmic protein LuxP n=1 Tax=Veronia pacifica TaxID=1080227 RepID=A0A1C3ER10_9GAMM|nr:ABC transporter substrate-binding protein [Veronia pacifica]ODA35693.1 LacI family transcriptional regulator [Veronia pacifica]
MSGKKSYIRLLFIAVFTLLFSFKAFAITVGFAQIGAESSWRTAETQSIKEEAQKRGYTLKFSDAQQKQENQIKAIRSFIAQGVDAIILAPVVETGWERVLREAKKAKIPVILVDRGIAVDDDSLYYTKVASDFIFEGRLAGSWLAQALHGQGKVVELQGSTGASAAIDRQKGFKEVVDLFPKLNIIATQNGEFTRTKGKEVMEAFLKAHGNNIDAVYAHNDDMALGAIQAIKDFGMVPGEDIKLISVDAVKGAFEAMIDGDLNATVECNPLLGPLAFDQVELALAGKEAPKWVVQDDLIHLRENAKETVASRKY